MSLVLGIDCGLTVTKAVVFDARGTILGAASRPSPHATPRPHWVQRDAGELWQAAAESARGAITASDRAAEEIAAVGVTGHGDGLYCVNADGEPTRPAISSLDSRAASIARRWQADGTAAKALTLTGQQPEPASPVTLLAWLAEHEPDTLAATRWLLFCKDWIKLALTGEASTDPTEASTSFTNVATQAYDDAVLELFGLRQYAELLPVVQPSCQLAGQVTAQAGAATGLVPGTPVVSGLHDVDASAIGSGAVRAGQLSVIAGTYSINQIAAHAPNTDPRWFARNFVEPGVWQHMAISPASATNLEWFVYELCRDLRGCSTDELHATLSRAYASVADEPSDVLFLPYLYGAPAGVTADAAFVGLKGWHQREHLLRAVLEGVVFNHRRHIDALADGFCIDEIRLTGGASRAPHWAQLFADTLNRPVRVVTTAETGALGAAQCALVGAGAYQDVAAAVAATSERDSELLVPNPERHARLDAAYRRFRRATDALSAMDLPASTS